MGPPVVSGQLPVLAPSPPAWACLLCLTTTLEGGLSVPDPQNPEKGLVAAVGERGTPHPSLSLPHRELQSRRPRASWEEQRHRRTALCPQDPDP